MPKKIDRSVFVNAAVAKFGAIKTISRQQVVEVCDETGIARSEEHTSELQSH